MTFRLATRWMLLLVLLGTGLKAHAACLADGPDLRVTMNYIVTHESQMTDWAYDAGNGKLTLVSQGNWNYIVDVMNADCDARVGTRDGKRYAWVNCLPHLNCILAQTDWADYNYKEGGRYRHESSLAQIVFSVLSGDESETLNLGRAMSHAVYLLQEQYKAAHKNNDPFAPQ